MKVNIDYPDQKHSVCKVVVHRWDLWEADATLARVIAPVIRKILERVEKDDGKCPAEFIPDFENDTDETLENEPLENWDKRFDIGKAEWARILRKILWSMEEIVYERNEPEMVGIKGKKLRDYLFNGGDSPFYEYHLKHKEYWNEVQEGCDLLGKYFRLL